MEFSHATGWDNLPEFIASSFLFQKIYLPVPNYSKVKFKK